MVSQKHSCSQGKPRMNARTEPKKNRNVGDTETVTADVLSNVILTA